MGDDGKDLKENAEQKTEGLGDKTPKVVIQIMTHPDGTFEMKTSLVAPMVIWIMEQIKFSLVAKSFEQERKIIQPRGGILNFARKIFRR